MQEPSRSPSGPTDRLPALVLITAGVLLFFSSGRWEVPVAPWLAFSLFVRFLSAARPLPGMLIGGCVFAIAFSTSLYSVCVPLGAGAIPLIFVSLVIAFAPFAIHRLVAPKLAGIASTLVLPLAAVVMESAAIPLLSTSISWSRTQSENLPLIQLASITGVGGVTFLMMWFAAVVNHAWSRDFVWSKIRRVVVTFLCIAAGVLLYGGLRLALPLPKGGQIRAATITNKDSGFQRLHSLQEDDIERVAEANRKYQQELFELTQQAARFGAQFVLWQEYAAFVSESEQEAFVRTAQELAKRERIHLVAAVSIVSLESRSPLKNRLIWVSPQGELLRIYDKNKPLPIEPQAPGDQNVPVIETELGRISPVICADADFPSLIRQAGRGGAGLLLVPTLDWEEIANFHLKMLNFRGIENGFSILRAGGDGISASFDQHGRMLSYLNGFTSDQRIMITDIPVAHVPTFYGILGNLFSWLAALGFLVLLALAFVADRNKRSPIALKRNSRSSAGVRESIRI